ncbi:methyltransferase domain-containing protein [Loktanella agnita]|uniref:methyltransferase domain-containing protein n=1 Tax=Loktanella agnita TaxID=287097 RepID=UPI0039870C15
MPIIDLGLMPRSDGLLDDAALARQESLVPLRLGFCPACTLVQLLETRPAEEMFGDDYVYFSSFSDDLLAHSRANATELIANRDLGADSLVVEIASNDGYMLKNFKDAGVPVLGVDPARQPATAAQEKGIDTINDFFTHDLAARLHEEGRRADIIIANNVVAHVADQNDLVAGMARLMADDGQVVVEFPYVRDMIDYIEFDTIYHEHLCYFSARSAQVLFARHGLHLNDVRRLPIHGGSIRLYFGKASDPSRTVTDLLAEETALGLDSYAYYGAFGARVVNFRTAARKLVHDLKQQGKRVAAYGAAAKGTIMLNYLGLDAGIVDWAADRNVHKQGKYMPGVRVPIADPSKMQTDRPDYVMILPWNFREEIIRQQQDYLQAGGKFIVPIPYLEVVGA